MKAVTNMESSRPHTGTIDDLQKATERLFLSSVSN